MINKKRITLLGATGSIGTNTLDIIRQHPEQFELVACSANKNAEKLASICEEFTPQYAALADMDAQTVLASKLDKTSTKLIDGVNAMVEIAKVPTDILLAGMVGASGVPPVLAALESGIDVALANKEALVCAGPQVMAAMHQHQSSLFPIDSEHNAIFQIWNERHRKQLSSITLTASGGPFYNRDLDDFESITPQEAVAHPNWDMGAKISVDSATMMNKALELIEAHYLFDVHATMLNAVVHPQSIVHAFISYQDGSSLAQLAHPDMRIPIAYCLAWPDRIPLSVKALDVANMQDLEFSEVDRARYPLFYLGQQALMIGQPAMVALNAANECAVEAFLNENIGFTDIHAVVASVLEKQAPSSLQTLEEVLAWDMESRQHAKQALKG